MITSQKRILIYIYIYIYIYDHQLYMYVCMYVYINGRMQAGHAEVGENLMQGKRMVSLGRINVEPASRLLK
jgi:hypothetical protein